MPSIPGGGTTRRDTRRDTSVRHDSRPRAPAVRPSPEAVAAARTLVAEALVPEVVTALKEAGVRPILLKGLAVARWLYQDGSRTYKDTDLLVDPNQVGAAESVLRHLGFEHPPLDDLPLDRPWHAHAWHRGDGVGSIDLHRTLIGVGVPPEELWRVLCVRTEVVRVAHADVEILDPPARALHVALHAAQDGARRGTAREDLVRGLDQLPESIWTEADELAVRLRAVPAFVAGLRLVPAGAELAARLGLPDEASVEISLRAQAAPSISLGLDWLINTPGVGRKLVLVAHKLVPPLAFMRAWSPLARRGPLGVVLAYIWRVVWLCRNTPGALRVWWRTRRDLR